MRNYPEWLVCLAARHHLAVIAAFFFLTLGILYYTVVHFTINTDLSSMISENLPFRRLENDLFRAFPQLTDTIVVVIDAQSVADAVEARKSLAERLKKISLFKAVYTPGSGEFFARNGLLYLSVNELETLSDRMVEAEPLLGLLLQDFNIRGLFAVIGKILEQGESGSAAKVGILLDQVAAAFTSAVEGRPYRLAWDDFMYGEKEAAGQRRQFIIIRPLLEKGVFPPGANSLKAVRNAIAGLGLDSSVRVRLTGDVVLQDDNFATVRQSVGLATFASLILVGLVILVGLGSWRLAAASLITLLTGLAWTTGFALWAVGSLNLISITFAVLFVGLGIDYSIQFCLRYRELIETGHDHGESIVKSGRGVGWGLMLSCITTALGFYAFLPTAYRGVAELGLISGTGMFVSLICNLTILPALLTLVGFRKGMSLPFLRKMPFTGFPYRYVKQIVVAALVVGICSLAALPLVRFDYNPLNLYDPQSEAIVTMKEMFTSSEAPPWTISVLTGSRGEADALAAKLSRLKVVKEAVTLSDLVPGDQAKKMGIISDIALFMPGPPETMEAGPVPGGEMEALNGLERTLSLRLADRTDPEYRQIDALLRSILRFKSYIAATGNGEQAFSRLRHSLLSGLPFMLKRLDSLLHPFPVTESNLPADLVRDYVSPDEKYRVQVFPREDIMRTGALARFVTGVQSVAPGATDSPVTVYETGKAIVSSFRFATLLALASVTLVLLVALRGLSVAVLVLMPLTLAILLTAGASVLFGLPLNYANVIVAPLLVGVGVHSGIMFMFRYLTEPPADGNMLTTSTARAILFSNLTMIVSSITLALSSNRGIAGMGILLTICFGFIVLSVTCVLPALLALRKARG